jgi:hypothetical protein
LLWNPAGGTLAQLLKVVVRFGKVVFFLRESNRIYTLEQEVPARQEPTLKTRNYSMSRFITFAILSLLLPGLLLSPLSISAAHAQETTQAPTMQAVPRNPGGAGGDYLSSLQLPKGQVKIIQAASAGAIPVFVHVSDPAQAAFLPCLYWSLDRWTAATNERIRFRMVTRLSEAKISITLEPGLTLADGGRGNGDPNAVGDTRYKIKNNTLPVVPLVMVPFMSFFQTMELKITVKTGLPTSTEPMLTRQQRVSAVMLHELGHALGLWGHSPNPADIMAPALSDTRDLTQRDINTIRRLYGIPAQAI